MRRHIQRKAGARQSSSDPRHSARHASLIRVTASPPANPWAPTRPAIHLPPPSPLVAPPSHPASSPPPTYLISKALQHNPPWPHTPHDADGPPKHGAEGGQVRRARPPVVTAASPRAGKVCPSPHVSPAKRYARQRRAPCVEHPRNGDVEKQDVVQRGVDKGQAAPKRGAAKQAVAEGGAVEDDGRGEGGGDPVLGGQRKVAGAVDKGDGLERQRRRRRPGRRCSRVRRCRRKCR